MVAADSKPTTHCSSRLKTPSSDQGQLPPFDMSRPISNQVTQH